MNHLLVPSARFGRADHLRPVGCARQLLDRIGDEWVILAIDAPLTASYAII
ncbi:hypothetical protein ACTWPB_09965 [Nocardia sp. IBHARD005]|uniref:hypothetical protein n=1 Tax=Nocardia sp. IBHARD005 TaxID=3457765 RepID=UPI004059EA75